MKLTKTKLKEMIREELLNERRASSKKEIQYFLNDVKNTKNNVEVKFTEGYNSVEFLISHNVFSTWLDKLGYK